MISKLKSLVKRMTPRFVLRWYHFVLTYFAAVRYGFPSRKLVVIAVTGTNGKSTTVHMISKLLEAAGKKVGATSSVRYKVADKEWDNMDKMTMLGRTRLQKMLSDMVSAGCEYAVIEASSEGLAQHRLSGVDVDVAVFTNLTPEHIESHGGFENYKKAKGLLFKSLSRSFHKKLFGRAIPKIIVANVDDEHAGYFLSFAADSHIGFTLGDRKSDSSLADLVSGEIAGLALAETSFRVGDVSFVMNYMGRFNVYNMVGALTVTKALGLDLSSLVDGVAHLPSLPGRMEWVECGQSFKVLVDYAPEPASLSALYDTLSVVRSGDVGRIIHVLGSCGGGRDVARRPVLGSLAAKNADIVVVTNEDPYDEDPRQIIEQVAAGAREVGAVDKENLFMIDDREGALTFALRSARVGDIVICTGKGSEHAIVGKGGVHIPWSEVGKIKEILGKMGFGS